VHKWQINERISKLLKYHIIMIDKIEKASNLEAPISLAALALLMLIVSYIPKYILSCFLSIFVKPKLITDQGIMKSRFEISTKGGAAGGSG